MFRKLLCWWGFHRHSPRLNFRKRDGSFHSFCEGCELPMVRGETGHWSVAQGSLVGPASHAPAACPPD